MNLTLLLVTVAGALTLLSRHPGWVGQRDSGRGVVGRRM